MAETNAGFNILIFSIFSKLEEIWFTSLLISVTIWELWYADSGTVDNSNMTLKE